LIWCSTAMCAMKTKKKIITACRSVLGDLYQRAFPFFATGFLFSCLPPEGSIPISLSACMPQRPFAA